MPAAPSSSAAAVSSGLLGGHGFALDIPNMQQMAASAVQPHMLAGMAGSAGVVPVTHSSGMGHVGSHLSGSAPPSSMASSLGAHSGLHSQGQHHAAAPGHGGMGGGGMSTSLMLEQLTAALTGAVAMPHRPDAGHDAEAMDAAATALNMHLGISFPGDMGSLGGHGGHQGGLPLPDHPGMAGVPQIHATPSGAAASMSAMAGHADARSRPKGGKPKPPRKRAELPNPGVNGSLGGATPAAIQAEGGFQCPLCDRVYKSESGLRLHRRTVHEGFQGYPCPHCSKLFTQKSHVKTHVRAVHEGKRDYACPVCVKLFTRASNRDRHVRTVHRNANIHPCDMCERVFVSEEQLRDHKSSHHGGENAVPTPLLCPQCHTPFSSKGLLNHHMRTVHGGEPTGPGSRGGKPKPRGRPGDASESGSPSMAGSTGHPDISHLAQLGGAGLFPGMGLMHSGMAGTDHHAGGHHAGHGGDGSATSHGGDAAAAAAAVALATASAGIDVSAIDADFGHGGDHSGSIHIPGHPGEGALVDAVTSAAAAAASSAGHPHTHQHTHQQHHQRPPHLAPQHMGHPQ